MKPLIIGKQRITPSLLLAPMEGVNDAAFRALCIKHGAGMTYSEMISAESLLRSSRGALERCKRLAADKPHALQLFGADAARMAEAAQLIEKKKLAEIIDVNAGCPAPNITQLGAGVRLMNDAKLLKKIIAAMVSATPLPVTVKIRSGCEKKNFMQVAKTAEKAGAAAIALHPRTATQGYAGEADWKQIKKLKKALSIPVIGNGDVRTAGDARRMMAETGCDAVMIGRAASTDPRIFEGKATEDDLKGKFLLLKEYLKLAKRTGASFSYAKIHAQQFARGFEGAAQLRERISKTQDAGGLLNAWESAHR